MARNAGLTDSKRGVLWTDEFSSHGLAPANARRMLGLQGRLGEGPVGRKLRPIILLLGRAVVGTVYRLLKEIETP